MSEVGLDAPAVSEVEVIDLFIVFAATWVRLFIHC